MRRHEPPFALDGGLGHGTESLERVCAGAVRMLQPGGFLALETAGGSQAHAVAERLAASRDVPSFELSASAAVGQSELAERPQAEDNRNPAPAFACVEVVKDTFGVERFVTARRT